MSQDGTTKRRYAGLDAEQRREHRRRRLLEAALELYGSAGYLATPIAVVCRAAGVAPAHFYELFSAKEDLLRALYDQIVEQTMHEVLAVVGAIDAGDPRGRIRAGLTTFCEQLMQNPRRARVHCMEIIGVSVELEQKRRSVIHAYRDLLVLQYEEAMTATGTTRRLERGPVEVIATTLVGGINETIIDWVLQPDPPPVSVVIDGLAMLLESVADLLLDDR